MAHERLMNELAFMAGRECLGVVASALHPCVHRDAFEEFCQIMKAALETYGAQLVRIEERLRPSDN